MEGWPAVPIFDCKSCKKKLGCLVQLYSPFHSTARIFYVFCCTNPACKVPQFKLLRATEKGGLYSMVTYLTPLDLPPPTPQPIVPKVEEPEKPIKSSWSQIVTKTIEKEKETQRKTPTM